MTVDDKAPTTSNTVAVAVGTGSVAATATELLEFECADCGVAGACAELPPDSLCDECHLDAMAALAVSDAPNTNTGKFCVCGHEISDGHAFCTECGIRLSALS
jgi:hypothetical protein